MRINSASAGRIALFVIAIASASMLLVGVFAQPWWKARWDGGSMEVSTGGNRVCIEAQCRYDSLDELEDRNVTHARDRKVAMHEYDRLAVERISRSRWMRIIAPVMAALVLLAAVAGPRRRGPFGLLTGAALVVISAAGAILAVELLKVSENGGDAPDIWQGAGFPLAFAGAVLGVVVGVWVAAPAVAMQRGASRLVAALAVVGALLLTGGMFSTWSWSTQTSPRGEVRPIRSATLLRATECYLGERCPVIWLGEHRSEDPPAAVWAGRITFAASLVTSACGLLLTTMLLRRRAQRPRSSVGLVAIAGAGGGAVVVLMSSAWFVTQVPKLSPVITFLGLGPMLAITGAVFSGAAAAWVSGPLRGGALPEAFARSPQ